MWIDRREEDVNTTASTDADSRRLRERVLF